MKHWSVAASNADCSLRLAGRCAGRDGTSLATALAWPGMRDNSEPVIASMDLSVLPNSCHKCSGKMVPSSILQDGAQFNPGKRAE